MLTSEEIKVLDQRLARMEGQVKAVRRMINVPRYCIDIINQLTAVANAATKASMIVMASHLRSCVKDAFASGDPARVDRVAEELIRAIFRQVKR